MNFTVTRPGGARDAEFQVYAGLLRQRGVDLGKLPRVRDPLSDNRWLPIWTTRPEAEAFADELKVRTGDPAWEVVETHSSVLEGPLGPVVIQMSSQPGKLTFALHPLGRVLIRSVFPRAVSHITSATIETGIEKKKASLRDLARQVVPRLTGLGPGQLETLGYAVVDAGSGETLLSVPPAGTGPT
jgi:hypothetical protein